MADGVVEVTPSTDPSLKKIDNEFLTVGANSVYRQRVAVPDGADVAQGATTDAEATGNGSVIAILKRIRTLLAGTLTIGGTVTANVGTSGSLALDSTLTGGTAKSIMRGGAKGTTTAADVTSTASGANHNAADVAIYDAAGNLIDPRSIRALTATDVVTAQPGNTANTTPWLMTGDVDHDAVNTLKNMQIAGNGRAVDDPPTAVSAPGDRTRHWVDRYGAQVVRRRKIRESYTAVFRLAETAARLDQTFTHVANTNKQWATLHHAASATKEIRLQKVIVWITGATTAVLQGVIELRELSSTTAPATGNPAITPRPRRIGTAAAEATALYLPTTQGSEAAANSPLAHIALDWGIMGAASTANPLGGPDQGPGSLVLFDASREDDEVFQPVAPVGVYGGWAITTRMTSAVVVRMTALMVFTEEIP